VPRTVNGTGQAPWLVVAHRTGGGNMIAIDWLMKIRNKLLGALRVSLPSQDTQPKLRNTNKIAIKRILNHSSYHDESLMISPGRAGVNLSPMTKRQRYSSVNCLRDSESWTNRVQVQKKYVALFRESPAFKRRMLYGPSLRP
jgi:hypothetical protein